MPASSPKKKRSASKPSAKHVLIIPRGACFWTDRELDHATEYAGRMLRAGRLDQSDVITFVLGFVHGARSARA